MKKGKIIIISAPSGTGKSTIINRLIPNEKLRLRFSVSATNREPRAGETDGINYHFLTTAAFRKAIDNDAFIEFEEVYPGRYYGTLKSEVERILNEGFNVILDIDVKGGLNVKTLYPDALSVFIEPPTIETLRQRLTARNTDDEETIRLRVDKAEYELSFAPEYDCRIVNDDLETAVKEATELIQDFIDK